MKRALQEHKTKIVCTIGPASRRKDVIKELVLSGMNVARLNFSHGDLAGHEADIEAIRDVAGSLRRDVAILADLPGPKIRIGDVKDGSIVLGRGEKVVLTSGDAGGDSVVPVHFEELPDCVEPGERIFINDGFIELTVLGKSGREVFCEVVTGGPLLSRKGMNLPDSRLKLEAVTEHDLSLMAFGLEQGVDMFGLSFVGRPEDIMRAREFAAGKGREVFLVAKIERGQALAHADGIIKEADAIMVARGDLGVEIPIEEVPIVQKQLILKANLASKPVITATQMLESMTTGTRPTRAEVTDVANAIFDGTDAVMLSEETAVGSHPIDALRMLVKIATVAESKRSSVVSGMAVADTIMYAVELSDNTVEEALALDVVRAVSSLGVRSVVVPTRTGLTARRISRLKSDARIFAVCSDNAVSKVLNLSYGVCPILMQGFHSDAQMIAGLKDEKLISPRETIILVKRDNVSGLGSANSLMIVAPQA